MVRALVYIVPVALAIYALIELYRSTPAERADLHRAAWVAIIVLLPVIGPVAWILISRSRRSPSPALGHAGGTGPSTGTRRPGPAWTGPQRRRGPVAPDDDPDFLWRLEQEQRRAAKRAKDDPSAGTDDPDPTASGDEAPPTQPDDEQDAPPRP